VTENNNLIDYNLAPVVFSNSRRNAKHANCELPIVNSLESLLKWKEQYVVLLVRTSSDQLLFIFQKYIFFLQNKLIVLSLSMHGVSW